jgi:hypothetical protein
MCGEIDGIRGMLTGNTSFDQTLVRSKRRDLVPLRASSANPM